MLRTECVAHRARQFHSVTARIMDMIFTRLDGQQKEDLDYMPECSSVTAPLLGTQT